MLDSSRPPFDAPWFREAFFRALENDIFHSLANGKLEPARQIGPASSWIRTDLYHLPDPDPVQSRSIVQSASAANRPVVFNICIALDEMDLPRELRERFLVDFRFSLRKCGLIPFTEELSPEGLILASQREDRPQVLITRIRSRIDDLAFEFSSLFAAGHWGEPYLAPVLDSIRPLFSKAESATPVSARRFLYESLIESLGRERIMGFLALESRNVLVSSEILNVRLGLEGTLDLEDAVFEAER